MKRMLLIFTSIFMLLGTSLAFAQQVCGPHEELTKRLEMSYHEKSKGFGLVGNGGLVELFVSDNGTWSFIITRPDGLTCLMAAGKNWEKFEEVTSVIEELS